MCKKNKWENTPVYYSDKDDFQLEHFILSHKQVHISMDLFIMANANTIRLSLLKWITYFSTTTYVITLKFSPKNV